MQNLSMCRICLATDLRLCSIASCLQDMYEKLINLTFKREDRRPLVACYICHARLENCYRLRTSCLESEELLTEMLSKNELVTKSVSSTNTLRVVTLQHFSLGHALPYSTECYVKDESPEVTHDSELEQQNNEDIKMEPQEFDAQIDDDKQCSHLKSPLDVIKREPDDDETDINMEPQEEQDAQIDNDKQCLHLGDPLDTMKREPDDVELNDEDLKLEIENTVLEENEPNDAGPPSQSANNIFPKIVKVVLERMVLNDTIPATGVPELKKLEENESFLVTESENVNKSIVVDKLTCDVCSKCFTLKTNLTKHMHLHNGENLFQCDVCNKYFKTKCYLKQHLYIHTDKNQFQCDVCNKLFTHKRSLTKHMSIHTDKRFQCNVCSNCYTLKSSLTRHMFAHTDKKRFLCDVCNKRFTQKFTLSKHMFTHIDKKRFQCNVCKKRFTHKKYLTKHMYVHTDKIRLH